ncbi:hypothetical protein CLF_107282 [Clonorchis sinensis]|uniref:Periphilin-1 C-terminal domain-containing protein n=1 Tax=Clonorchis sinensis TaxID=79923 RepID=G7YGI1_CLOSI|nr:hypothetical protein CLF_107282 [Clonorchis sinensis]
MWNGIVPRHGPRNLLCRLSRRVPVYSLLIVALFGWLILYFQWNGKPHLHGCAHPKNRHPSLSDADRMGDEVKPSYTSAAYANPRASTPGLVVVGLRETPTRSPVEAAPDYSFSNAPAPAGDGGSSLVSGLIQLKRRNQPDVNESRLPRRKRRNSVDSSSSELSAPLDTAGAGRLRTMDNRLSSLSPLANTKHLRKGTVTPDQAKEEIQSDLPKRKRQKRVPDSPDSLSPPTIRGSYVGSSKQPTSLDQQSGTRSSRQATSKIGRGAEFDRHQQSTDDSRIHGSEDERFDEAGGWPQSARRAPEKVRRSAKPVEESLADDSSYSETEFPSKRRRGTRNIPKGEDVENESKAETAVPVPDDPIELIRQRKETLAQVCFLFIVYVTDAGLQARLKDTELEGRLMPMLKEILHERGQRCIEELRTFIADHQSELEKTEGTEIPVS